MTNPTPQTLPEALRLANYLEKEWVTGDCLNAARELRRLHAEISALAAQPPAPPVEWSVKIMQDWDPRRLLLRIGVQQFYLDIHDEPDDPGRMEWHCAQLTGAMQKLTAQPPADPLKPLTELSEELGLHSVQAGVEVGLPGVLAAIVKAMKNYRCQYHQQDEDNGGMPLADVLTEPGAPDIRTGLKEILHLAEDVFAAVELAVPQPPAVAAIPEEMAVTEEHRTTALKLALCEIDRLVKENFGRVPRDDWADEVLGLRDALERHGRADAS